MTSRTRHPLSLPPPPQPKPLATPPTSPEMSPAAFGTFPRHYQPQPQPQSQPGIILQPKISPSKRILRRKKSGLGSTIRTKKSSKEPFPSPLPEGKENQDEKSGLRRKRSTGVEEREKERTGRFASRLRSVRSVPLLNSRTDKDKEKDNENVGTRDLFGGRATMRNMDRRDSGKVMEMTMGESEVLSEESHVGRYGLKSMMNLEDSHPLARYPTSQASASSTNMVEFGYLPSSAELDGGFGSISSRGGGADRKDPAGWQYSSISTGTASNFASLSSSSKGQGKGFSRERSETVTTFGGATSTSGSGSPRSMTTTIRIDLRDETTPRAWTGRRRSSEASEIGQVFGMTPGTGSTVRAAGLGIETNKEDVYRRSRDLQRVIGGHDEEQQGHRRTIPNDRGDEESIEEIRDTEEMQQRFLQRHSQDFAHLHSQALASMFQPSEPRSLTSAASVLTETSPTLPFDPRETEDERQRRIIEEARREGREKRRSWMLSKAGLINGPMSPTTTFYGPAPTHSRNASSISSSILSPGASLASPRLGEMTPRAHQRQTSLRGGIRPLSLVISQENARARESAGSIVLGPPLVTSPVSVVLEEEEKSDVVGEMTRSESTSTSFSMSAGHENEPYISHAKHWSGHHRGSIHSSGSGSQGSLSRSVSIKSHRRTMSPAQQALPPHLRSFSASSVTMTNSSMSSLGAVIGGGSESSCSSGEHIGGPRVLSSDAFNFRMSVNAPAPRAESRMTNSTYAMGSFRTESRLTMRGPTPDGEQAEDRESRIQRRRARAFLVAGLKLESKAASASSQVVAEQDETDEWPMSPSEGKKDRRAGVVVENKLDLDNMEVMSASAPVERKRYSVMRREKQDDVPTLRRAGTPLFPFYSKPSEAQSEDSVSPDVLPPKGSPEITISVVEESGNIRPIPLSHEPVHFPRDESENSLQDPSAWRAQSGEMIRELFWLPSTQGDVTDVPTTPTRPISRPPSPAVIHSDSAGASPGRERKTSWSNAARGWLRSESKTDPEAQVEKGFGPGRGGDLSNTLTSTRDDRPSTPAPEKKSWKRYLGGAKTKRRGSLPEAFRQDLLTPTLQAPPAAHVRRSTEPSSPAYCVAGSPPAFPSLNNRQLDSSPLSAASFSPQTPECLTRSPGMRIVLSSQTPRAQGMEQGDILLPTPGMSHGKMSRHQQQSEGAGGSPSRMDMTGELYGLGLGPVQAGSPWKGKGKATSMAEEETWQRNFAEQAVALVQMSNQAAAGSSKKAFGLGRRPDVGIHAKSTAAPFGDYLQPPPSATLRPSSPAYSNSSESETEHDQLKTRTRQAGCAVDVDNLPAYHDRSIVLKHERRILPAKLFFMLGFLLGPWVWLFGGWALSPAGQYLPSTHIPLGLGHRRDSRFSPQSPPEYKQRGIRAALPPMNRDRPEKWVKRNRLAAVASSAVFIPAMCVGFGYLGKLL